MSGITVTAAHGVCGSLSAAHSSVKQSDALSFRLFVQCQVSGFDSFGERKVGIQFIRPH